jgi:DNA-binding transcriptional ArsR family regulator
MNDPLQPKRCAEQLGALAAPERLKIVRFLREGPHNVTAIAKMLHIAPVNVTHHVGVLRQAGIIRGKKRGRFVYYSLVPGFLKPDGTSDESDILDLGCCRLEVPRNNLTLRTDRSGDGE